MALPALFGRRAIGEDSGQLTLAMPQWCAPKREVSSRDFDLVGDDSSDNTQQLEKLRSYLVEHDGTTVNFVAGNYRYTNFRWLQGVRNVMLRGVGVVGLRNVAKGPWDIRRVTLMANSDMLTGPQSIPEMGMAPTYRVESVAAGAQTLHVLSSSPVADVAPGTPIIISGYNQYNGGWPPCLRYSEFATVTSVDWNRRSIALSAPLAHSYQSHWPSQTFAGQTYGPATIVSLQRTAPLQFQLAQHHIYENLTFLANPNGPAYINSDGLGGLYTQGVRFFEMRNCKMYFFGPNESQWVKVSNCTIGATELGKMVGAIEILNSSFGNMTEATAVELLIIRGSKISNRLSIAPRRLIMTGNTIASSQFGRLMGLGTLSSHTHVDTAFVANNEFVLPQGSRTASLVSLPPPHSIDPIRRTDSGVVIPASSWPWLGSAAIGSRLFSSSGASAVITDVVAEDANTQVLTAGPSLATTTGPLSVKCVTKLMFSGNTVTGDKPAMQIEDTSRLEQLITAPMAEASAFATDYVNLSKGPVVC